METLRNESEFRIDLPKGSSSIIKVIGVGGGGNNALKHMYEKGIKGVDFIICNTDAQALDENPIANKIQLGIKETEGLGAGADPEVGKRAAQESIDEIKEMLGSNTKMVFITAGMGGGTGTGAAPVIAKIAKDMGILTVVIVTIPFNFEGPRRLRQAEQGLEELRENVDSLIVINNDKLRQQFGNLGFKSGFAKADEVLSNAAKGIAEVITGYFIINIDFRDAKSVLQNSGTALMSEGVASGDNRAEEAVRKALDSPLLNDNKITGAKDVLLLIRSGNQEVTMDEVGLINDHIQKEAGNTADIIFGIGEDEALEDDISVLVIATGFAPENRKNTGSTERISIPLEVDDKVISEKLISQEPQNTGDKQREPQEERVIEDKKVFRLPDVEEWNHKEHSFMGALSEEVESEERENNDFETYSSKEASVSFLVEESQTEEQKEYNLFSYDGLEPVSYTFDLGDSNTGSHGGFQSFEQKEKEEFVAFEVQEKEKEEEIVVAQEEKPNTFEVERKEEFTIMGRQREENEKVMERRNKLREFNSRYQATEESDEFETVPAFKRKNIMLDLENASEKKITNFYSEENGVGKLQENRFLNKDVD